MNTRFEGKQHREAVRDPEGGDLAMAEPSTVDRGLIERPFGGDRLMDVLSPVAATSDGAPISRIRLFEGDSTCLGYTAFLQIARREMRRADRSKSPLSLAILRVGGDRRHAFAESDRLAAGLCAAKRETDYVGQLDAQAFAVLFPDTGIAGFDSFRRRVLACAKGIDFSVCLASYPEDRFEALLARPIDPKARAGADADARADEDGGALRGYPLKRTIDVVGAAFALMLFAPIMLATALAVVSSSRGPIIFRQKRLGKGGKPFVFYKFRSMTSGADDAIHRSYVEKLIKGEAKVEAADAESRAGRPCPYKMTADPRVTWVGRLIRKTSIDELPQLWNVLKGDMSLVGPRPPVPYEAENYQPWHLRRLFDVKPGITGLWQVEGRSRVSFDDMVRMDLQYIRNCSLTLDLHILLRTVRVVLRCEGAT